MVARGLQTAQGSYLSVTGGLQTAQGSDLSVAGGCQTAQGSFCLMTRGPLSAQKPSRKDEVRPSEVSQRGLLVAIVTAAGTACTAARRAAVIARGRTAARRDASRAAARR